MLLVTGKRDVCCYADAVRLSSLTKLASNAEVEAVIKEWLRTSRDCSGGRRQREAAVTVKRPHPAGDALGQDTSADEEYEPADLPALIISD